MSKFVRVSFLEISYIVFNQIVVGSKLVFTLFVISV